MQSKASFNGFAIDDIVSPILKEMCEQSLLMFTRYIFKHHYNKRFEVNSHHLLIEQALQDVECGVTPNICINIAPRHTKTELVVKMWMAYTFARNPQAQFVHTSYSDDLALDNSAAVREIIESEAFQKFWPVKIDNSTSAKKLWKTTAGGGVRAGGSGGAITGFGAGSMGYKAGDLFAGCVLCDDPLKPDDAFSTIHRDRVNQRLSNTLASRRNSPAVPFVIVMQRLHENDPTGFALSGGIGMKFHNLKLKTLDDDGNALWPAVVSAEYLKTIQKDDRYTFASQYQQEPAPTGGGLVKIEWFKRYRALFPEKFDKLVHSWDTASKGAEYNDPSVCTVWGVAGNEYYLLDVYRARVEYPELKRAVMAMSDKYQPDAVLIEDKSSGQALLQELKKETRLPLLPIMPKDDKITRLSRASGTIESGRCYLPERADWLIDFERELALFPNGQHDDQCDSVSQFINWINAKNSAATPSIRRL